MSEMKSILFKQVVGLINKNVTFTRGIVYLFYTIARSVSQTQLLFTFDTWSLVFHIDGREFVTRRKYGRTGSIGLQYNRYNSNNRYKNKLYTNRSKMNVLMCLIQSQFFIGKHKGSKFNFMQMAPKFMCIYLRRMHLLLLNS